MNRARRCPQILVLCAALSGCSDDPPRTACAARSTAALYNGTPHSPGLDLSAAQRAAIGMLTTEHAPDLCTATLIRPSWALSAAHCDLPGDLWFRSSNPTIEAVRIDARVVHPSLDVLLAHLSLETQAAPIGIFPDVIDADWLGQQATLAGLGQTEVGTVGDLLFAAEPIVGLTEDEIAMDGMGESGACVGDSGGPLLVNDSAGVPVVLGTLRRGEASCLGLDYYIRADRFVEWILDEAGAPTTPRCALLE